MTKPWYNEGLRFKCTGCGQCCTGFPGVVWVSEEEMKQMAEVLAVSVEEFKAKYTRQIDGRYSLTEDATTFDCVFLEGKKCQVYAARPKQCRTFPWWPDNLKSKKSWAETARGCEGINHPEAPLVKLGEIQEQLNKQLLGE